MAIIVEDGRCPPFANSYLSLEDADAYCAGRGLWPETTVYEASEPQEPNDPETGENDAISPQSEIILEADNKIIMDKENALIRAFDFLNTLKWKGKKPCWERIPAWPRENVPIPDLEPVEYIEPDFIPQAVLNAQCELAGLIYNGYGVFAAKERGGLYSSISESNSQSVDCLSESTSKSLNYRDNAPIDTYLPSVYPLIAPFLEEIPGQVKSGFTVSGVLRG